MRHAGAQRGRAGAHVTVKDVPAFVGGIEIAAAGKRGHAHQSAAWTGRPSICTGDHLLISRSGLFRSAQEHAPMRVADPFIVISHVIGSLRVIHDFGPTPGLFFRGLANILRIS